ncbi:transposase [Streptomyces sp. NPDC003011]
MTRGHLTDAEWELTEPHLPLGAFGPIPDLRSCFNEVMWRFRTGSPWRDVPDSYGSWSTIYDRFRMWARDAVFQTLMAAMIAEAAARDDVDLSLASVDSTVVRAHHHAAGTVVDPELLEDLRIWRRPCRRKRGCSKGAKRPRRKGVRGHGGSRAGPAPGRAPTPQGPAAGRRTGPLPGRAGQQGPPRR